MKQFLQNSCRKKAGCIFNFITSIDFVQFGSAHVPYGECPRQHAALELKDIKLKQVLCAQNSAAGKCTLSYMPLRAAMHFI